MERGPAIALAPPTIVQQEAPGSSHVPGLSLGLFPDGHPSREVSRRHPVLTLSPFEVRRHCPESAGTSSSLSTAVLCGVPRVLSLASANVG